MNASSDKRHWVSKRTKHMLILVAVVIVYYWAITGTETSVFTFLEGIPNMVDFLTRMFPPDLDILGLLLFRAGETLQIAIMGTTIGVIVAFPLSFFAARNVMPYRIVYQLVRLVFDVCRGVNEIIWALLFVSMVGLGPFPGVLALAVHLIGALGRYFSEAIETVNPNAIKAVLSTGANKIQTIVRGIIPDVKPLFANYIFYYFEHSVRAATVLGLVGAGGIGIEIINSIKLFKYSEVLTALIIVVLMVVLIDRASAYLRKKIIKVEVIV